MEAETKVGACEEKLAGFRAAINATNPKKTEAAAPVTPAASRAIGPKFERQSLPSFKSGKLRDYPTFKKDWQEMVTGNFESAQERRLIRNCVPESVRDEVTRMSSMDEIWEFLDDEFGKGRELMSE